MSTVLLFASNSLNSSLKNTKQTRLNLNCISKNNGFYEQNLSIAWYLLSFYELRTSNWMRFRWAFCYSRPIIMSRLPCLPRCSTCFETLNPRVTYGTLILFYKTLSVPSFFYFMYSTHCIVFILPVIIWKYN